MTDDKWISFINWHYFDNDSKNIINHILLNQEMNELS